MPSIAHANEGFWNSWNDGEPWIGDEYRTYIGSPPYLSTRDGSTSHLAIERFFGQTLVYIGVTLVPFTITGDGTISVQSRVRGPSNAPPYLYEFLLIDKDGEHPVFAETNANVAEEWETFSVTVPASELAVLAPAAAAGQVMLLATGPVGAFLDFGDGYDVSWLDFSMGAIPTRVYPRADGLGMGAPRLMDNRSPYRSPRVFGTI